MPRTVSRSPPYRRRRSPSPRYNSRRSRRDRSRSPYSHRRKSRSPSPRRRKSHSRSPRKWTSRSPSLRRHKRQRSRSMSISPTNKSESPSLDSIERKNALEKKRQEEEKKRLLDISSTGFSEGSYWYRFHLLYLMMQLVPALSTVHQFENSYVWIWIL
ncbi:hypothetical protein Cni_G09840 [Canna indica]|uniref:Uncharacterized protein n=1 Tax=Canna indica TaxID=4628 RepID=A0AAQ3Q9B5_9LILI|nr:hypothetical protein Cni_G09840 [Canna indica]